MNPILYRILLTVGIQILKYLRRQQAILTAEQKAEIETEMAKPPDEQWWNKDKGDGG